MRRKEGNKTEKEKNQGRKRQRKRNREGERQSLNPSNTHIRISFLSRITFQHERQKLHGRNANARITTFYWFLQFCISSWAFIVDLLLCITSAYIFSSNLIRFNTDKRTQKFIHFHRKKLLLPFPRMQKRRIPFSPHFFPLILVNAYGFSCPHNAYFFLRIFAYNHRQPRASQILLVLQSRYERKMGGKNEFLG